MYQLYYRGTEPNSMWCFRQEILLDVSSTLSSSWSHLIQVILFGLVLFSFLFSIWIFIVLPCRSVGPADNTKSLASRTSVVWVTPSSTYSAGHKHLHSTVIVVFPRLQHRSLLKTTLRFFSSVTAQASCITSTYYRHPKSPTASPLE